MEMLQPKTKKREFQKFILHFWKISQIRVLPLELRLWRAIIQIHQSRKNIKQKCHKLRVMRELIQLTQMMSLVKKERKVNINLKRWVEESLAKTS